MIDSKLYVRRASIVLKVSEAISYSAPLVGWWWAMINHPPAILVTVVFGLLALSCLLAAVSATIMLWGMRAEKRHDLATDYADKT